MKKQRIAILHPTLSYNGGAERLIIQFSQELNLLGIEPVIFTAKIRDGISNYVEQKFANLTLNPLIFQSTGRYLLWELISFDAVIIHNFPATIFWGLTCIEAEKRNLKLPKSFWYCHEPSVRLYGHNESTYIEKRNTLDIISKLTCKYDKFGVSKIEHIISNSEKTKSHIKLIYGREAQVIYPAIKNKELIIKKTSDISEPKHFFYVGRIEKAKNIENAIAAFSLFLKQTSRYDIRFIIAGSGRYQKHLVDIVSKMDIKDNISFTGYISDEEKVSYLSSSYALIMPAAYEPFGLNVLEAWAAGTTAIISIDSGVSEIATGAAMICDVTNPEYIFKSMISIFESSNLRSELIKRGREIISTNEFNIETHTNKVVSFINNQL